MVVRLNELLTFLNTNLFRARTGLSGEKLLQIPDCVILKSEIQHKEYREVIINRSDKNKSLSTKMLNVPHCTLLGLSFQVDRCRLPQSLCCQRFRKMCRKSKSNWWFYDFMILVNFPQRFCFSPCMGHCASFVRPVSHSLNKTPSWLRNWLTTNNNGDPEDHGKRQTRNTTKLIDVCLWWIRCRLWSELGLFCQRHFYIKMTTHSFSVKFPF